MIKNLPREKGTNKLKPFFKANGTKYRIRTPEEGIGIERIALLYKMSGGVGYGVGLGDQQKNWKRVGDLLQDFVRGKNNLEDIFALIKSQHEGIGVEANEGYSLDLYLCTLFIVKEDEDLTQWSKAEADEKIEDWNKEGYNERDFRGLALTQLAAFLGM